MGFVRIDGPRKGNTCGANEVTMVVTSGEKSDSRVGICIGIDLIKALGWEGERVDVFVGNGRDSGFLQIEPGGRYTLSGDEGRLSRKIQPSSRKFFDVIPPPAPAERCTFDKVDRALIVKAPSWWKQY